MMDFKTFTPTF